MEKLQSPLQYIKGVGPKKAALLGNLGLVTWRDLLWYLPFRYEDRSRFCQIRDIREAGLYTIKARIVSSHLRRSWHGSVSIFRAVAEDGSGKMACIWFNQPFLAQYLKPDQEAVFFGRVEYTQDQWQMRNPEFELIAASGGDNLNIGRIVPVYSTTEGISQRFLRKIVKSCLDSCLSHLKDYLPFTIRQRYGFPNVAESLLNIHFPKDWEYQKRAYRRMVFEEFFLLQVCLKLNKRRIMMRPGISYQPGNGLARGFLKHLGFTLTASQNKALQEIAQDLARPRPMHRLLQGEVGSGKTVVAAYAAAVVLGDGQQVAFMVPTEILAQQHYRVLRAWFEPLGVRVFLLTAALPREDRQALLKVLSQGEGVLVVGTHALIQEEVVFAKLGLVIIDEQHKFGVSQRQELCNKADNPELLIMTATPIPRTLAMSLYADLDISTLHELPAGRSPVETMLVESQERERAYKFVEGKIKEGRQAYIIYPIIEGSSVFGVRAAGEMYRYLAKEVFPELRLGLTHGRLPVKKSQAVMESFRQGRLDIMVATTVLEVGVDVPNAAVMVIEGAERFGLSQLHQLRGRIGRGSYPSYCILIPTAQEAEAQERLEVIVRYRDGFRIAEEDLKIRGPGEFFGCRQHGLSELRISSPLSECQLLEEARQEAEGFLRNDPSLKTQPGRLIREGIERSFPACASWPAS